MSLPEIHICMQQNKLFHIAMSPYRSTVPLLLSTHVKCINSFSPYNRIPVEI